MKRIYFFLFLFLSAVCCLLSAAFAQAPPPGINYQAVARDVSGNPLAATPVTVTFNIDTTNPTTAPYVYSETQTTTTNQFGLFTLIIGSANPMAFDTLITWWGNTHYLEVIVNGNNMGTTQFWSVPYSFFSKGSWGSFYSTYSDTASFSWVSFYSAYSDTANFSWNGVPPGTSGQTLRHDGFNWVSNNNLFNSGDSIGIGTTAPAAKLHIEKTGAGDALLGKTNGSGNAVYGANTGTGRAGYFQISNTTSNAEALSLVTNGSNSKALNIWHYGTTGAGTNYGAYVKTDGPKGPGSTNVGGYFTASGAGNNYAAIFDQGNVGIGTQTPTATFSVGNAAAEKLQVSGTDGDVNFLDPFGSITFPALSAGNSPMIQMFATGTSNPDRMVIAHSPSFTNWGLQYQDFGDKFNFLSTGSSVLTVDLGSQRVGIGTATPLLKLDARGTNAKAATAAFQNIFSVASNDAATPLTLQMGIKTDATAGNRYGAIEVDDAGTKRNLIFQPSIGNIGIGTTAPKNKLKVAGSFAPGYVATSATSYSASANDCFIVFNVVSTLTLNLPSASSVDAGSILVVRTRGGTLNVNLAGGDFICPSTAGACSGGTMSYASQLVRFVSDGVNSWYEW